MSGRTVLFTLLLGVAVQAGRAGAAENVTPEVPVLTDEQTQSLQVLEKELSRLGAAMSRIDDLGFKGAVKSTFDGFKDRCDVLRGDFEQTAYDELLLAIMAEHQRVLRWLAPLKTPPKGDSNRKAGSAS